MKIRLLFIGQFQKRQWVAGNLLRMAVKRRLLCIFTIYTGEKLGMLGLPLRCRRESLFAATRLKDQASKSQSGHQCRLALVQVPLVCNQATALQSSNLRAAKVANSEYLILNHGEDFQVAVFLNTGTSVQEIKFDHEAGADHGGA